MWIITNGHLAVRYERYVDMTSLDMTVTEVAESNQGSVLTECQGYRGLVFAA